MFFGFILYLITISIIITLFGIALHLICLGCILFYSIFWELIENFLLIKIDLKFGKRKDSLINSFMDLCFFSLGGAISMFNMMFGFTFFLINILTLLTGLAIIFYVYAKKILKII